MVSYKEKLKGRQNILGSLLLPLYEKKLESSNKTKAYIQIGPPPNKHMRDRQAGRH